MAVTVITSENFEEEVVNSKLPVMIDFWASWCGPCKMFSQTVEEFAVENQERVKVCKVNIDDEPELAGKYGVMSIPTVILFTGGKPQKTIVGVQPKAELESLLK